MEPMPIREICRVHGNTGGAARARIAATVDAALTKVWWALREEHGPEVAAAAMYRLVRRAGPEACPEWLLEVFRYFRGELFEPPIAIVELKTVDVTERTVLTTTGRAGILYGRLCWRYG